MRKPDPQSPDGLEPRLSCLFPEELAEASAAEPDARGCRIQIQILMEQPWQFTQVSRNSLSRHQAVEGVIEGVNRKDPFDGHKRPRQLYFCQQERTAPFDWLKK
ncbi:MAG: hypothetical protein WEB60_03275 [Terrimicrobiaceae bacterium]